jgi:uncharacterized protein
MLEQTPAGVVIAVQAQPRARKNGIVGTHADRLKVAVTQAPEKGKANDAFVKVLAAELGLKRSQITLLSGTTSSQKKFLIADAKCDDIRQRLAACLDEEADV